MPISVPDNEIELPNWSALSEYWTGRIYIGHEHSPISFITCDNRRRVMITFEFLQGLASIDERVRIVDTHTGCEWRAARQCYPPFEIRGYGGTGIRHHSGMLATLIIWFCARKMSVLYPVSAPFRGRHFLRSVYWKQTQHATSAPDSHSWLNNVASRKQLLLSDRAPRYDWCHTTRVPRKCSMLFEIGDTAVSSVLSFKTTGLRRSQQLAHVSCMLRVEKPAQQAVSAQNSCAHPYSGIYVSKISGSQSSF